MLFVVLFPFLFSPVYHINSPAAKVSATVSCCLMLIISTTVSPRPYKCEVVISFFFINKSMLSHSQQPQLLFHRRGCQRVRSDRPRGKGNGGGFKEQIPLTWPERHCGGGEGGEGLRERVPEEAAVAAKVGTVVVVSARGGASAILMDGIRCRCGAIPSTFFFVAVLRSRVAPPPSIVLPAAALYFRSE